MRHIHQKSIAPVSRARGARAITGLTLAGFGLFVALEACNSDRLLSVATPNNVPVAILDAPENASLMVNSAITDFECAFGSAVLVDPGVDIA